MMNFTRNVLNQVQTRQSFCTSACLNGKKTRIPFDKRFPVTAKHVNRHREGGSEKLEKILAKHVVQPAGIYDKRIGRFKKIPEMIPEFVVPDLKGFKLKPYVSYKVPEVTQTKFTAKDLFNVCYARDIVEKFSEGKITLENCTEMVKDSKDRKS